MRRAARALLIAALVCAAGVSCKQEGKPGKPGTPGTTAPAKPTETCGAGETSEGVTQVPPPAGEKADDGDVLVRRLEAEPGTLNQIIATDEYAYDVNYYVIDNLLDLDLDTGEFKPMLAESWEVGEDRVTFTFHLRKNVTWHDGQPFTADDVIYSMTKTMDPKVDAANLRSYYEDCESYTKLDDYTAQFKWKKPYFKALESIGNYLPILPKHILDNGADFNGHPYGRKPVGTGPYQFVNWTTGQEIRLKRYDGYWGPQPHFEQIQFKIITDDDVALKLLKKGDLDAMVRLRRMQWARQTSSPDFLARFHKLHFDYPGFSFIAWNLRKPLLQDKRVRQALTMLLNREAILKEVFYCLGTVATGPFYYKTAYSDPEIKPWPYDPERAKKLLAEAGWKDANNDGILDKDGQPFRFELSFSTGAPEWEQLAVMFKEDLVKAGIDLRIRKLEWAVFLENVQQWKFDGCVMGFGLEAEPDPFTMWYSGEADKPGSFNQSGFKNAEVDRLILLIRGEFDRNKRIEYDRQVHRIIHEEQPFTFIISGQHLAAVDKRIHNLVPHPIRPIFYFNQWYAPKTLQKYGRAAGP